MINHNILAQIFAKNKDFRYRYFNKDTSFFYSLLPAETIGNSFSFACRDNNVPLVEELLYKTNIYWINNGLEMAINCNNYQVIKIILQNPDPNIRIRDYHSVDEMSLKTMYYIYFDKRMPAELAQKCRNIIYLDFKDICFLILDIIDEIL